MKKSNEYFDRILRTPVMIVFIALSALSLSGCLGSGGGDDVVVDDNDTSVKAFNFNADNSVTAAKLAVNTMSFFPAFTEIGHTIISELAVSDPGNSPFDLGICTNSGSSMLTWTDTDSSLDLSAGDTTSLVFTNCDIDGIANGTVNFVITRADLDSLLPDSVAMTVTTSLSIFDDPDTIIFAASFKVDMSTADNDIFTIAYIVDDSSGQKIDVSENGAELYKFGCFNVSETYSTSNPSGTYSLAPAGVIYAANTIMSLGGGAALVFSNDMMESGTKRLLSFAVPECASVGVPNGVGDSDGSYLDMEALGGGYIQLHTFDATDVQIFITDTTWDSLLLD